MWSKVCSLQLLLLLGIVYLAGAQTEICTAGDHNIEPLIKQVTVLVVLCTCHSRRSRPTKLGSRRVFVTKSCRQGRRICSKKEPYCSDHCPGANDMNYIKPPGDGYWVINLADIHCNQLGFSSSCKLYIAFCQEITPNIDPGCDSTDTDLGPTSVCVSNGTLGYSIGAYDVNENPFAQSINSPDIIADWFNGSNTDNCIEPGSLQTRIMFKCNPYATWENPGVGAGEATNYLVDFFVNFEQPCQVIMTLGYDKVCKPALCEAEDYHDTQTLSSPDYWQVNSIPELACREFFQGGTCTLYTSFCKSLSGIDHCKDVVNTSVCITNGTTDYSLGIYNHLVNPFVSFSNETLLAAFSNGSHYPKCPDTYNIDVGSIVSLKCDSEAKWSQSGGKGDASDHLTAILPNPENSCQIFIEYVYSGACFAKREGKSNNSDNVGLPGLIILLVLAVVVTLYLVVGSIYNVARGKSGCPEMLPQYGFWRSFFMSAVEGVYFSADFITCGLCTRQAGPPPSSEYEKL